VDSPECPRPAFFDLTSYWPNILRSPNRRPIVPHTAFSFPAFLPDTIWGLAPLSLIWTFWRFTFFFEDSFLFKPIHFLRKLSMVPGERLVKSSPPTSLDHSPPACRLCLFMSFSGGIWGTAKAGVSFPTQSPPLNDIFVLQDCGNKVFFFNPSRASFLSRINNKLCSRLWAGFLLLFARFLPSVATPFSLFFFLISPARCPLSPFSFLVERHFRLSSFGLNVFSLFS